MKQPTSLRLVRSGSLAAALAALLATQVGQAAVLYWDGSTSTRWNVATNWSTAAGGGTNPTNLLPSATADLVFTATGTINNSPSQLRASLSAKSLLFRNATAYTVTGGGSNRTLTLGSGGITVNSGAGAVVMGSTTDGQNVAITLAGAQSWTNDSANALTIVNRVTDGGFLLTLAGSGSTSLNGIISGSGGLTQNGAGTTTLNAANTYAGLTTVSAGTLAYGITNALSGALTVNGGTLDNKTFNDSVGAVTLTSGSITGSGTLTASSYTFNGTGAASAVLAGTGTVTKSGAGTTTTLSGANTFTGVTTLNSGTLSVGTIGNGGAASNLGAATNAAANLVLNGGTLQYTGSGETTTRAFTLGTSGGTLDASGSGALTISGTPTLAGTNTARALTLSGSSSGDNTLSSVIPDNGSGATSLVKSAAGTWVLAGSNTYTGATTINAGTLRIAADSGLGTAPGSVTADSLVLNGGTLATTASFALNANRGVAITTASALDVGTGTTLTYDGIAAGTGDLTKSGLGTLILTGQNTLSGAVTVSSGTLQIGDNTAGGSIASTSGITNNGALVFYRTGSHTYSNVISGSGTLTQTGTGTLVLTGTNTYSGTTTISSGTLQIGDGVLDGSIAASSGITNNSALVYNLTGSGSSANVISGTGTLTKTGAGTLALSGTNTYSGATTISAGTLSIAADLGLGTAPVSATAGQLVLGGGTLAATETFSLNSMRGITTGGTLDVATDKTLSYGGIAAGTGTLTKTGAGALVLTGTNSYTGATTISGGTLQIGDGVTNGSIATASAITANGALIYNVVGTQTSSNVLSGNGTLTKTGAGTLVFTGASSFSGAVTIGEGTVQIGDGISNGSLGNASSITNNGTLVYSNLIGSPNFSKVLGGTGAFTMSAGSAAVLTMSGANTYAGATTVTSGTLKLGNASALGAFDTGTTVASGATLDLLGQAIGAEALTLSGTGVASGGALVNSDGTAASFGGAITLAANSSVGGAGEMTLGGAISGDAMALTKVGVGILNLGGTNTYSGATTLSGGTLNVTGSLAGGSSVAVASGTTLSGTGTVAGLVTVATGTGAITAGNGTSGTLTLSGGLTFSGTGTINIGTLSNYSTNPALNVADTLTTGTPLTLNGTTGAVTLALPSGGLDNGTYHLLSYGGTFSNLAGLTFTGAIPENNTLRQHGELTNDTTNHKIDYVVSGDNPVWSGANGGIWTTGTTGAVGATPSWATEAGLQPTDFWLSDNAEFNDTVNISGVSSAPTTASVSISGSVSATSILFDNSAVNYTVSGGTSSDKITGGAMVKTGSGSLTITNANTYTGGTTLNAGVLRVGNDGALGTGLITLDGGTLSSDSTTAHSLANNLAIHGAVTLGNATATGALTFSGGVDLNGTTRVLTVDSAVTMSGVLSGTDGGLTKAGSGTLTLSNTNTYSGDTTLAAGTLTIHSTSSLGAAGSMLNFTGNSTLQLNASFTAARDYVVSPGVIATINTNGNDFKNSGVIAGTGDLTKSGLGTLILTGQNTLSGAVTVSGGTLQIGDNTAGGSIAGTSGITNNGALVYNRTGSLTYSNVISGSGTLTQTGTGTLVLTGTNTYSGTTTISSGTLQIGDGVLDGSIAGSSGITNSSSLVYNLTGSGSYANVIGGTGTLTKTGAGTLTLAGSNTYSGQTTISGGTLSISNNSNLGAAAAGATLTLNGGTLRAGTNDITLDNGGANQRAIVLGAGGGTFDTATAGKSLGVSGVISGAGALTKAGAGTLTLSGANTYGGPTTISAGTLSIAAESGLGAVPASLTPGALVLSGGTLATTGSFVMDSRRGVQLTALSTIEVATGTQMQINGLVAGVGGLTKTGAGTLELYGRNTFDGDITLNAGTLEINSGLSLGDHHLGNGDLIFAGDGTLKMTEEIDPVFEGRGYIISSGKTATFDSNANMLTHSGIISGSGALTKIGAGTMELAGSVANAYTGTTTVSLGSLKLNKSANTVAVSNNLTINGGTVEIAASGQLAGDTAITLVSGGLNFGSASGLSTSFGTLTNSGGTFSTGANTLTGTGATVTWSGGTNTINDGGTVQDSHWIISGGTNTVNGGTTGGVLEVQAPGGDGLHFGGTASPTLTLDSSDSVAGRILLSNTITVDGTLTSGTAQILSGGSAINPGYIDLNGGTRTLAVNDGSATTDLLISAQITNGGLIKTGAGTLTLSGANTFSGSTLVSTGTLQLGNNLALQNSTLDTSGAGVINASGFTAPTLGGLSGSKDLTSVITTGYAAVTALTLNPGTGVSNTYSGVIANGASGMTLTKTGAGTQVLSGNNTYTGTTTIGAGTLVLGNDHALGGSGTTVAAGATLDLDGMHVVTEGLTLSGTGVSGAGALTNGDGTAASWSGAITLAADSSVGGIGEMTLSGEISGSGTGLTKVGEGILNLTVANIYTGATTLSGGTLNVTGSLAGGSSVAVASGTTLTGTGTVAGLVTVADGTAAITAGNGVSGTFTLSGGLTFDGTGTINIGTLGNYSTGPALAVGTLTLSGGAGAVTLALPSGGVDNGTYHLLSYGGTFSNLAGLTFTGAIPDNSGLRQHGELFNDAAHQKIDYVVSGDNPVWSGANGGIWTTGTTGAVGATPSWATEAGHAITDFWLSDNAEFNDTVQIGSVTAAPTTTLVSISGSVSATSILFDNSAVNYTVSGGTLSDKITGGAMVKTGSGTLTITNANTYTGGTTLNLGSLQIGNDGALGSGDITLNGGTLSSDSTAARSLSNPLAIRGNVTLGNLTNNGPLTFSSTVDLDGVTKILTVASDVTLAGVVYGTDGGLTKAGDGALKLFGANTYTGDTTLQAGTLAINSPNSLGASGSSMLFFTGNSTLRTDADITTSREYVISPTVTATINTNGHVLTNSGIVSGSGALTKTGAGTLVLSGTNTYSGTTTISTGTLQIGDGITDGSISSSTGITNDSALVYNLSGSNSYANVIGGSGALTKTGAGTLTLSGTNTFGGKTLVENGTLAFASGNASATAGQALGINTTLDLGKAGTSSGVLEYTGSAAATLAKNINALGTGSDTIRNNGGGLLTLAGTLTKNGTVLTLQGGSSGITVSGTIAGASANSDLIVDGGIITLNAANTYNGPTYIINGATLNANATDALPTANGRSAIIMDATGTGGSTLALGVAQSIASLTGIASSTVALGSSALTVGTSSGSTPFAGAISGTGGLVKDGASIQILAGTNTYTGGTTVSAGTLVVNGSLSATGVVSVSGTLAGTGTVGGATAINSGGTHAPGAVGAVGTQSFSSSLNYASGSIFEWDLTASGDNMAGMAYDMVGATGNITVDASSTVFKIVFGAGVDMTDDFWSAPHVTQQWAMTSIFGKAFTSGAFASVQTSTDVSQYGSFTINGSTLDWTSSVPEPRSVLVGLLLGAGLLRREGGRGE